MKNILIIMGFIGVVSCGHPVEKDATAVCDCYKVLYQISTDDEVAMEAVADSCQKIHSSVLKKLEGNEEAKAKFIEAYTFCQNEK